MCESEEFFIKQCTNILPVVLLSLPTKQNITWQPLLAPTRGNRLFKPFSSARLQKLEMSHLPLKRKPNYTKATEQKVVSCADNLFQHVAPFIGYHPRAEDSVFLYSRKLISFPLCFPPSSTPTRRH